MDGGGTVGYQGLIWDVMSGKTHVIRTIDPVKAVRGATPELLQIIGP